MELTYAKNQQDLEAIADLMSKVFARLSYYDFYKLRMGYQTLDPLYKPEHSRIIKEEGRIVSHVSIIEKFMRIGQSLVKIGGIGDVCTHPDCRGKSYSRILMEDAVKYMKENGYGLSMLYGIPNYYHKFGYIEAMGKYSARIPVKFLKDLEIQHTLRPSEPGDRARLNELYNQAYKNTTGSMERVEAHWYKMQDPKRLTVALKASGEITGYVILSPPWKSPIPYIQEAVVPDASCCRSILGHFGSKNWNQGISELELYLNPENRLMQYAQLLGAQFGIRYYGEGEGEAMLRIINLEITLNSIREELETRVQNSMLCEKEICFNIITDDMGSAAIKIRQGKIQISNKMKPESLTLRIPQNGLVRSLIGYWSVNQINLWNPEIKIDEKLYPWLKVLFPLQNPVTSEPDYF